MGARSASQHAVSSAALAPSAAESRATRTASRPASEAAAAAKSARKKKGTRPGFDARVWKPAALTHDFDGEALERVKGIEPSS